jgi:hypothetical protein
MAPRRPRVSRNGIALGQSVNPLAVRFTSAPVVDTHLADAVKARLQQLLSVGMRG